MAERHRDKQVLRAPAGPAARRTTRHAAPRSTPRSPTSTPTSTRLDALLERQNYRLAFWRTAERELDYRRFFDIDTLVGLRVEDPDVFDDTHALILRWVADGVVDGLRIDHPDGLRDPEGTSTGWPRAHRRRVDRGREDPRARRGAAASWPVAGTTGYDFLNVVGGLFVDPAGERRGHRAATGG